MRKALFLLTFLILPAFAQRQAIVYDLGVETFSTIGRPGIPRFYASGSIYPAGTYTPKLGQPVPRGTCDKADDVMRVGYFVIYGESGSAGKHQAIYRLMLGEDQYYFSGEVSAVDELNAPASLLFDLLRLSDGQFQQVGSVEYSPRSMDCFGGQIKLFLN